jgi:hypothetical protein
MVPLTKALKSKFYAQFIKDNRVKEVLLSVTLLQNATADGHLKAAEKELEKHGLLNWLSSSNLTGISTDDAASLLGTEHGLIKKVRSNLSNVIGVHCVAHRLNLSVLSAVKNGKFIDDTDSTLKKLYKFYRYSPERLRQLKQVAESLQTITVKCQYNEIVHVTKLYSL